MSEETPSEHLDILDGTQERSQSWELVVVQSHCGSRELDQKHQDLTPFEIQGGATRHLTVRAGLLRRSSGLPCPTLASSTFWDLCISPEDFPRARKVVE